MVHRGPHPKKKPTVLSKYKQRRLGILRIFAEEGPHTDTQMRELYPTLSLIERSAWMVISRLKESGWLITKTSLTAEGLAELKRLGWISPALEQESDHESESNPAGI